MYCNKHISLRLDMYIHMCIHRHIHIHIHIQPVHMHIHIHIHMHIHMRIHIHKHMHIHMHIHILYIYIYLYIVCTYIYLKRFETWWMHTQNPQQKRAITTWATAYFGVCHWNTLPIRTPHRLWLRRFRRLTHEAQTCLFIACLLWVCCVSFVSYPLLLHFLPSVCHCLPVGSVSACVFHSRLVACSLCSIARLCWQGVLGPALPIACGMHVSRVNVFNVGWWSREGLSALHAPPGACNRTRLVRDDAWHVSPWKHEYVAALCSLTVCLCVCLCLCLRDHGPASPQVLHLLSLIFLLIRCGALCRPML